MRALIVDDSAAMRALLRMILTQCGFEVTEAKHGKDGIAALEQIGTADLALVDWNMPEMGGLDFLRTVRAEREFDSMRIMMVTTETDREQVQKALQMGANEYVMKPFNREIIVDKLHLMGF